jgi:hypothetical protein
MRLVSYLLLLALIAGATSCDAMKRNGAAYEPQKEKMDTGGGGY